MGIKSETVKLLIVDDEVDIREILQFNLENEGYLIDTAASAEEALKKLSADHKLILLDVMMAGMSGFKMANQLRKEGNTVPIIFLTAKNTENDMLTGFSIGGDDYISKPFSIKEVVARVKSVLKRSGSHEDISESVQIVDLVIDYRSKSITIEGKIVELTKTEFNILTLLTQNEGRIFSRTDILDKAWGDNGIILERTVDVHINRLRKKLGRYSDCIVNRVGYGYTFNSNYLKNNS